MRKVTGGSRSAEGAEAWAKLASLMRMASQQGRNVLETVKQLLLEHWAGKRRWRSLQGLKRAPTVNSYKSIVDGRTLSLFLTPCVKILLLRFRPPRLCDILLLFRLIGEHSLPRLDVKQ
jgi:hypothetical protein